jgi:hypothetical protein
VEHGARLFEQPTCLHRPDVGVGPARPSAELLRDARGGSDCEVAEGPDQVRGDESWHNRSCHSPSPRA